MEWVAVTTHTTNFMKGESMESKHEKELLLHIAFGTGIFLALASAAIGLDLLAVKVAQLGVSTFTSSVLSWTAHIIMGVDLVLFAAYTVKVSIKLLKELYK